ncbi:hypothetical protein H3C61_04605 [Candidatus Gracilibacteria bacterium]|nr:hypothetical protein [Candidatus Gracilibacteria bacterium]
MENLKSNEVEKDHNKDGGVEKKYVPGNKIEIQKQERLDHIKQELGIIKELNSDKPNGEFLFMGKSGKKDLMKIDIKNGLLEFDKKTIKIELPQGASISKLNFGEEVSITGKLGIFSGSGSTSYEKLIIAIDEALEKGSYKLIAGNKEINFNKLS